MLGGNILEAKLQLANFKILEVTEVSREPSRALKSTIL
jgi:hypothetical protein